MENSTDLPYSEKLLLEQLSISLNTIKYNTITSPHRAYYRAVINWVTKYKPSPNAPKLERVRVYLEAFYHLCNIEDWHRVNVILNLFIKNSKSKSYKLHH